ncbi:hypothetical protein V6N13_015828 [Hibiscus sabdariffa]
MWKRLTTDRYLHRWGTWYSSPIAVKNGSPAISSNGMILTMQFPGMKHWSFLTTRSMIMWCSSCWRFWPLLLTDATSNILVSVLIAAAVVFVHISLRKKDDLYEEENTGLVSEPSSSSS